MHRLTFNVWVKAKTCLHWSRWQGRKVADHPNYRKYQEEVETVKGVLKRVRQRGAPGSAVLSKGGGAYGESSSQVMETVTTITYKIMSFKASESCCDIGYGIGTTSLIYNAARNNLQDN